MVVLDVCDRNFSQSFEPLILCFFDLIVGRLKLIFLHFSEQLFEFVLFVFFFCLVNFNYWLFRDNQILLSCRSISLAQVDYFSLERINRQCLCSCNLQDPFYVNDNLVEVMIFLLELLESLLLVYFENLFFDPDSCPLIFLCFFLQIILNQVLQRRFCFLLLNFTENPHYYIFQSVLKSQSLL